MGARTFTDERLIEDWERIDGIASVARELDTTYATVNNRVARLRRLGVSMRDMPRTPRDGCRISALSTPEVLGVDPDELRGLVEAFRWRNG